MNRKTSAAKRSLGRKAACLSITAALAISAFAGTSLLSTAANAVSAEEYGLADNIQDGVILQDRFAYTGVFDLWGPRDPSRDDNTTYDITIHTNPDKGVNLHISNNKNADKNVNPSDSI